MKFLPIAWFIFYVPPYTKSKILEKVEEVYLKLILNWKNLKVTFLESPRIMALKVAKKQLHRNKNFNVHKLCIQSWRFQKVQICVTSPIQAPPGTLFSSLENRDILNFCKVCVWNFSTCKSFLCIYRCTFSRACTKFVLSQLLQKLKILGSSSWPKNALYFWSDCW